MFDKFVKNLENPEYPSMGPVIKIFKTFLLWPPSRTPIQNIFHYVCLFFAICYAINMILYMILIRELVLFLSFFQYASFHLGLVKTITYAVWFSKWNRIIKYTSEIEKEALADPKLKKIIDKYIKDGRFYVYSFLVLCVIANGLLFIKTWVEVFLIEFSYRKITKAFYIFWPLDVETRLGRLSYVFAQNVYGYLGCIYVLPWDALVITTMKFISGQMRVIRMRCVHALDSDNEVIQRNNLIKCHKLYLSLLEVQDLCKMLISPTMFIHFLMFSINFGVFIATMSTYETSDYLIAMVFASGLLLQLLLYHWHSDEVMVESEEISYGVFESAWVEKSARIRKEVAILAAAIRKKVIFTAGPYYEITLSTFVGILRASYSFYTLISNTREK